jgi:hypothetical protein
MPRLTSLQSTTYAHVVNRLVANVVCGYWFTRFSSLPFLSNWRSVQSFSRQKRRFAGCRAPLRSSTFLTSGAAAKALPHAVQVADRWHLMENASRAAVRKSMRSDHRAFGDNNGFVQGSVMQLSKPAVSEAAFVRCLPGRRMLSAPSLPVVTDEFTYRSADRENIFLRPAIDQDISAVFGRFNLKQPTIVHFQPGPRYLSTFYLLPGR